MDLSPQPAPVNFDPEQTSPCAAKRVAPGCARSLGPNKHVTVRTAVQDGEVTFAVRGGGGGIVDGEPGCVARTVQRPSSPRARDSRSAAVRRIIEVHGGCLDLQCTGGNGLTLTFVFESAAPSSDSTSMPGN